MGITESDEPAVTRPYWLTGIAGRLATGLCGIIAVLVAIKATASQPGGAAFAGEQDLFTPILAFAALTVWIAFAIGVKRRGVAALISLAFAIIVEIFVVQSAQYGWSTLISANLGIVLAYCSLHLYWLDLARVRDRS